MSEELEDEQEPAPERPAAESNHAKPAQDETKKTGSTRKWFGWSSLAVVGAIVAIAANLSEIAGWFAPDDTRELVEETRSTMQHTDEKVSELISLLVNQAAASGVNLDIASEDAIRNAVEAIAVSGNRQKQAALDKVAAGDVAGAAESLVKLAETQAEAVSATSSNAAETWVEAAALYESIDLEKAAESYEKAAMLSPGDPAMQEKAGHALYTAGRMDAAEARFELAIALGPEAEVHASALRGLGHVEQRKARYDEAASYFNQALDVATAAPAEAQRIYALRSLGLLNRSRGDTTTAMTLLESALSDANEYGDERIRALVLMGIGTTAAETGDYETADARLNEALDIYKERDDRAKQALVIGNLGATALKRGDIEAAEPFLLESVALGEALNWQSSIAYDLINLAMISGAKEEFAEADERLGKAQAIAEEQGLAEILPVIIFNRGEMADSAGDMESACRYWGEATPIFVEMGSEHAGMARERLAEACPAFASE